MNNHPSIASPTEQKRKFWGKMIWISAITLVLSVCAGISFWIISMIRAFNTLSTTGSADPADLANDISLALILPLIAAPFALASLILFITAIIRHRKFSKPATPFT